MSNRFARMRQEARQADSWLLSQALDGFSASVKGASVGNLVNIAISFALFAGKIPTYELALCSLAMLVLVYWRVTIDRQIAGARKSGLRMNRIRQQVIANGIAHGALWGFLIASMFALGDLQNQVFGGIIGAGMMGAGAIGYRTVGPAAYGYVICCAIGGATGLLLAGHNSAYAALGLLICYLGVLSSSIRTGLQNFHTICEREREVEKSRDTIRLLLNDYTEQGSDWLVETDRKGLIINPSSRFAEACRRPVETLAGKKFTTLLDDDEATLALREHVRHGRSFRNHIVSLTSEGEKRWWSISGRAVHDGDVAYRGVITDITAQRQAEEKVSYLARYDGLTDLPNRFLFNETLYHAIRRDAPVALMYLDLDHFKAINDTLGHPVGDHLLQVVARRLEKCIGRNDMLARLGGDEFAILLKGSRIADVDKIAAKVIAELGKSFTLGDHQVVIGATIGIACAPEHGDDPDLLMRNADLALYAAKGLGRNRAARFEPGMDEAAQQRRLLEMDLRSALGKREMRLHYQPLINVESGLVTGYEALIRWEHPERGVVMPATFIPIAEDTGMIVQIGEWVIRQALHDLSSWPEALSVSINLSPAQMRSPTLISTLVNAVAHSGVATHRVCLEITENVLMQDSEANIETLHKLRDMGVQIALDDFGTGYSSLNYLRSFPFSKIKIDRCFIGEIDSREDCRAIVRSVVSLANSLGMTTTAEGVEREEQVASLRAEGCGEMQGYLYSKAVPIDQLSDLRYPEDRGTVADFTGKRTAARAAFEEAPLPRRQQR